MTHSRIVDDQNELDGFDVIDDTDKSNIVQLIENGNASRPMRRLLFLFLLSISGIPIFVNIKKYKKIKKMAHVIAKQGKKITKKKYKNKNKMCKGGGQSSLFALSDL